MGKPKLHDEPPLWDPRDARLWTLRSLLSIHGELRARPPIHRAVDFNPEGLAYALNVDREQAERIIDRANGKPGACRELLRQHEYKLRKTHRPVFNVLDENLKKLGRAFGMHGVELSILKFYLLRSENRLLREVPSPDIDMGRQQFYRDLAYVIDADPGAVREALRPNGVLARAGLLDVEWASTRAGAVELEGLGDALLSWPMDLQSLFGSYFRRASQACRDLEDFAFLGVQLDTLKALIEAAVKKRAPRVNILLHGVPGTGKTELCRTLGHAIGADLYEITHESNDGVPLNGNARFRAYALCQHVLRASQNSLVVFDEVEDAFRGDWTPFGDHESHQKAWINRILEENPVPAIWISNRLDPLDSAYLRRFDYTLELCSPPPARKRVLLDRALEHVEAADQVVTRAARCRDLTPADIERTGRVVSLLSGEGPKGADEDQVIEILSSRPDGPDRCELKASVLDVAIPFDPALINAGIDCQAMVQGIRRTGSGRFCFYGPPGTGKTAFAHHVAAVLDKELEVVAASDWLNPFVGVTERLIRRAFVDAERNDTVLFIDEADTFLRCRAGAQQSFQASQTNELLKRLELAKGVVIIATNFMDGMDKAVLRRLDVKAKFDYLRPPQTVRLFRATLRHLTGKPVRVPRSVNNRLRRLTQVACGDFTTCARRLTVLGRAFTANQLLSALAAEIAMKSGDKRSIGFMP